MLEEIHKRFIDKFLQTNSIEEAAKKAGIPHDEALGAGIDMMNNPEIQEALKKRVEEFNTAYNVLELNKERIVSLMMVQYEKAIKLNRTKEAVEILAKMAEATGINFKDLKIDPINFIINNLDKDKI